MKLSKLLKQLDMDGLSKLAEDFGEDAVIFAYEAARKAVRKSSGIEPGGTKWNSSCIGVNIWGDFVEGEKTSIFVEDGGIGDDKQGEILEYVIDYLTGKKREGKRRINVSGSFGLNKSRRKIEWVGGDPVECRELARRMNDMRLEWRGWDLVFYSES